MLHPNKGFAVLGLLLAGCATQPPRQITQVSDWQDATNATSPAVLEKLAPIWPLEASPKTIVADQFTGTWIPLNRWCKANGLGPPVRTSIVPLPTYSFEAGDGLFVFGAGSQVAHWQDAELRMGFAPQLINGQPFVHTLDVQKTIAPLITGTREDFLQDAGQHGRSPTVVIDPGHGGENAGTKSVLGNRYEKEFTLDWARRLQALLATNGWQVLLTRTNDSDLALSNRVAFAEEHKADLFLSLHFNSAGPKESEAGLETYCLTPTGMPSTVTRGFSDEPAAEYPNNAFDEQNLQLALRVHRALLEVNGHHDRGVRRARFLGVLRGQQRPAILVEGGYLSNPREARLISDPAYRQKLAEALAKALGEQRAEVAGHTEGRLSEINSAP